MRNVPINKSSPRSCHSWILINNYRKSNTNLTKTLSENRKEGNLYNLWGHLYWDIKTRKRHSKKGNLQTNISYEPICKIILIKILANWNQQFIKIITRLEQMMQIWEIINNWNSMCKYNHINYGDWESKAIKLSQ